MKMLLLVLAVLTVGSMSVSARTYYIPSSQKTVISKKSGYFQRREGEVFDEIGNSIEDDEFEYIGMEEYPRILKKFPNSYNGFRNYYSYDP